MLWQQTLPGACCPFLHHCPLLNAKTLMTGRFQARDARLPPSELPSPRWAHQRLSLFRIGTHILGVWLWPCGWSIPQSQGCSGHIPPRTCENRGSWFAGEEEWSRCQKRWKEIRKPRKEKVRLRLVNFYQPGQIPRETQLSSLL